MALSPQDRFKISRSQFCIFFLCSYILYLIPYTSLSLVSSSQVIERPNLYMLDTGTLWLLTDSHTQVPQRQAIYELSISLSLNLQITLLRSLEILL